MKRYLFVSGCPRSGTTALATILNWAPRCFIGQERFNMLFNRDETRFVPALFEPSRMRRFEQFDCGYSAFEAQPAYSSAGANPAALAELESAEVVGDKLISLWRNFSVFDQPPWEGKDVHILHIIRNVVDVAASYQSRFRNEADNWSDDFEKGVEVWSRSIRKVSNWRNTKENASRARLHLITYDGLFECEDAEFLDKCRAIFGAVGLEFGDAQQRGLLKVHASSRHVRERRAAYPEIRRKVEETVEPGALKKYDILRERALV